MIVSTFEKLGCSVEFKGMCNVFLNKVLLFSEFISPGFWINFWADSVRAAIGKDDNRNAVRDLLLTVLEVVYDSLLFD